MPHAPHAEAGPDEPFDAGVSRWCSAQGKHSFCADFDGRDLLEGWQASFSGGDPSIPPYKAVPSDRSAPRAFSVTQPAASHDAGTFPESFVLGKAFTAASPTSLRVSFDLKVEQLGLDNDTYGRSPIMVALTHHEGMTTTYSLAAQLSLRATKTELHLWGADPDPDGGFVPSGGGTIESMPIGRWVHVELQLSATPSGGTATVSYDSKPAGTFDISGISTTGLNGAYLEIGARSAQYLPHDSIVVFDSVVADVH